MCSIRAIRHAVAIVLLVGVQPVVGREAANGTQAGGGGPAGSLPQPQPKARGNPYNQLFKAP
jgi:hypothetical protein